ncbi:hypothetical protein IMX26_09765 [Clostridium sp. 'deep sea']|uniref:hypothetical protein n=1 Tax=Clostridium sp. 'deep sea' TaxID=2779445 RepID=UPI001896848A|nr:hypothetical protein [Clostridium sp. 'deep sea']QOR33788.1 hypothetical protein IMX26_09765 [Clostridium sp. 'deep sea']
MLEFMFAAFVNSTANLAVAATGVAGLIAISIGLYKSLSTVQKAEKCPRCGWPMHDCGWVEIFSGAVNKNTNRKYQPIAVRVHKCAKCKIEKHEKTKKPEIKVGLYRYDPKIIKSSDSKHLLDYAKMPINFKRLHAKEYDNIIKTANTLINRVNENYNKYADNNSQLKY